MTFFFFLPSILLSGFMFPFRGMPQWAQWIGEVLPLTHFLRIVRGIMLKGNTADLMWGDLWPMLAFMAVAARGGAEALPADAGLARPISREASGGIRTTGHSAAANVPRRPGGLLLLYFAAQSAPPS